MSTTYKRKFPIHHAARRGDQERVKHLIKRGVSVDSRDVDDRTPLHWTAVCGRYEVAQLLFSNHCNVDLKDRLGRTSVMEAAKWGRKDVADLLLQRGAQVNCADKEGVTLLHLASGKGWVDVVQRIVESGATDVNAATLSGETPLMFAVRGSAGVGADFLRRRDQRLYKALYCGCQEVVKQLLIARADTNKKNIISETALSFRIRRGKSTLEEIRLFVQHGFFFEDCDYALISQNPVLKEHILKDVDLCTQSIVNKFHRQSLPALYSNPNLAKELPCIEKFHLTTQQVQDIENFVKWDIQTNTFCNIVKARPLVLGVLCVQSLLAHPTGVKRSASSSVSDSNSPLKKARHN